jgi:hypothetical protein
VAARLSKRLPMTGVRHPSYGGQTVFRRQVQDLYALRQPTLFQASVVGS